MTVDPENVLVHSWHVSSLVRLPLVSLNLLPPFATPLRTFLDSQLLLVFFLGGGGAPAAYGGSQARGQMGAAAAGLRHIHSNATSLTYAAAPGNAGSFNPLSEARDPSCILTDTSWVLNPLSPSRNFFEAFFLCTVLRSLSTFVGLEIR